MSETRFKPGQKKTPGSGRKKGTPNKKTIDFLLVLEKNNFDPGEELIYVYNQAKSIYKIMRQGKKYFQALQSLETMQTTADKICQFVYPKRKAIEHSGDVAVKTFADFIAAADEDTGIVDEDEQQE